MSLPFVRTSCPSVGAGLELAAAWAVVSERSGKVAVAAAASRSACFAALTVAESSPLIADIQWLEVAVAFVEMATAVRRTQWLEAATGMTDSFEGLSGPDSQLLAVATIR